MNISILFFSILFLIIIFCFIFVMFKKFKINSFRSVSIYFFLALFWIFIGIFSEQIKINNSFFGSEWQQPFIIFVSYFIQIILRFPYAIMSQKYFSRKIPIIFSVLIFMILSIYFLIEINYVSLILLAIGVGSFMATFGLENQYFLENWNQRNIFKTMIVTLPLSIIGTLFSYIFYYSFKINNVNFSILNFYQIFRWILLALFFLIFLLLIFFWKKSKDFIYEKHHNLKSSEFIFKNKKIESIKTNFIDLIKYSLMFNIFNFIQFMFINKKIFFISDFDLWTLLKICSIFLGLIFGIVFAKIFIKKIFFHRIVLSSHIISLICIGILTSMWFNIFSSTIVSIMLLFILTICFSVFDTACFGIFFSMNQHSKFLVLPFYFAFKSLTQALGFLFSEEEFFISDYSGKIISLVGIGLVISSLGILSFEKLKIQKLISNIKINETINS